jgi:hypothetical protein
MSASDSFPAILFKGVINTILQLGISVPHSILFGSIVLYMVTMNLSFGVFAIFILEIILSHRFLSWIITETSGPALNKKSMSCNAGFKTIQAPSINRILSEHEYPSYSFFSITAIATYLGLSTNNFSDTMNYIGTQWTSRPAVAYMFITCVLIAFLLLRLIAACDDITELMIAFIAAVICGAIFFKVNKTFFGDEAINFLGLPFLVAKDAKGDMIYVCSKE